LLLCKRVCLVGLVWVTAKYALCLALPAADGTITTEALTTEISTALGVPTTSILNLTVVGSGNTTDPSGGRRALKSIWGLPAASQWSDLPPPSGLDGNARSWRQLAGSSSSSSGSGSGSSISSSGGGVVTVSGGPGLPTGDSSSSSSSSSSTSSGSGSPTAGKLRDLWLYVSFVLEASSRLPDRVVITTLISSNFAVQEVARLPGTCTMFAHWLLCVALHRPRPPPHIRPLYYVSLVVSFACPRADSPVAGAVQTVEMACARWMSPAQTALVSLAACAPWIVRSQP
jgi:hypothetical protein